MTKNSETEVVSIVWSGGGSPLLGLHHLSGPETQLRKDMSFWPNPYA